ncbi:MAG: hypothetical protein JXB62_22510 [Pirellulales bacterium]|nr:hypothetical protein [Pirellulales bacterium]
MRRCLATAVCFLLACTSSHADSWSLPREVKDIEFAFGDVRIVLHYDTTHNQTFPAYTLNVYLAGKLVGEHAGVGFEQVFASADHAYFLGVSNSGLTPDAFVLFDRNGQLLKRQPHDARQVHYFTLSMTLRREWFDSKNPGVRFTAAEGRLKDVLISVCDGSRVSLMIQEDLRLRAFLLEDLLKTHAKPREICYVCFGTESTEDGGEPARLDPPKRFLDRFQKRPYQIMPVSAYPKQNGLGPWPVKNPQTGIPDGIYTVEIVEWLDPDTAKVRAGMYRSGLWAQGYGAVVKRQDGKWQVKKRGEVWIS